MNNGKDDEFKEAWNKYYSIRKWNKIGGYIDYAIQKTSDHTYVFFQGSEELMDWLTDAVAIPVYSKSYKGFLHGGIYHNYKKIMQSEEFDYALKGSYGAPITFIGYSVGGAYATLVGRNIQEWYNALYRNNLIPFSSFVTVITFAMPRFNWLWQNAIPNMKVINVELSNDPVPYLFAPLGYIRNVGKTFVFPSPYRNPLRSHAPSAYNKALQDYMGENT